MIDFSAASPDGAGTKTERARKRRNVRGDHTHNHVHLAGRGIINLVKFSRGNGAERKVSHHEVARVSEQRVGSIAEAAAIREVQRAA